MGRRDQPPPRTRRRPGRGPARRTRTRRRGNDRAAGTYPARARGRTSRRWPLRPNRDPPLHRTPPRYRHRVPGRRPESVREPHPRQGVSRIGAATRARDDLSRLIAPDEARSPQEFNDTATATSALLLAAGIVTTSVISSQISTHLAKNTASANHRSVPPRHPTPRVLRPIHDP